MDRKNEHNQKKRWLRLEAKREQILNGKIAFLLSLGRKSKTRSIDRKASPTYNGEITTYRLETIDTNEGD